MSRNGGALRDIPNNGCGGDQYDTDHSLSLIQLTHCATVKLKSEGDVVVGLQWHDGDPLYVFSLKVVSHYCIGVIVPLKPLEIQSIIQLADFT